MDYDLSNENQVFEAYKYLNKLVADKSEVKIIKPKKKRSNPQNRYWHKCVSIIGLEMGLNLDEAKLLVKRYCGCKYVKKGEPYLRSTSGMDVDEMTNLIKTTINWAAEHDIILLSSEDYYSGGEAARKMDETVRNGQEWLRGEI